MPLTLEDFRVLIDTYGGDPDAWPTARRAEALALLDLNADARTALATLRHVEKDLHPERRPKAPAGLADRILRAVPRPSASSDGSDQDTD
jgi:hypothetical protein